MEGTASTGGQWLKYSCLGCVGLVAVVILIVAGVMGLAWNRASSAKVEDKVLTRDLPAAAETPGLSPESIAGDMPDAGSFVARPVPGRVFLDLSDADFHIRAGAPGEPVRLEASYDLNSFELEESFEEAGDGTWDYRVRFHRSGSWSIIGVLSQIMGGHSPRVTLYLPPDSPLALDLDLSHGGGRMDFGGLWLTEADLEVSMGGYEVEFSEPLREPMQRLSVDFSMGGGAFGSIGNASPRVLQVSSHMGGMALDLSGRWIEDAGIRVNASMGGVAVRLPDGVRIEGLDDSGRNRSGPEGAPLLSFELDVDSGEVEFVD